MKLMIYNIIGTNTQISGYDIAEADNIEFNWIGESWEQFEKETGFNESHLGGLKLIDGKIIYDDQIKQEYEYSLRPLAMGVDIVRAAQESFGKTNFILRAALLDLFERFPIHKDFLPKLDNGNKEIFDALVNLTSENYIYINLKGVLESPTCNPMSVSDFETLIQILSYLPDQFNKLKDKYLELAMQYKDAVRLLPYNQ